MKAVNLIPAEQRRSGGFGLGRSGGAAYVVLGLICGLAVMALLYGLASHEVSTKQAEANQLTAEAQLAQGEASKLAPYTSFVAVREERLKDVQELANTRFDWAHVMHELGRVLPSEASLSSVTATVGAAAGGTSGASGAASSTAAASATAHSTGASGASGSGSGSGSSASGAGTSGSTAAGAAAGGAGAASSVTSATPAGSTPTIAIAGCATSQSEVALTMDRFRLMDGVTEVTLQSSSKSGGSGGGGGGGGGAAGGCGPGGPTFSMQVTFDSLPAPTVKTTSPAVSSASNDTQATGRNGTPATGSAGAGEVRPR